jgi:hypothetical protein
MKLVEDEEISYQNRVDLVNTVASFLVDHLLVVVDVVTSYQIVSQIVDVVISYQIVYQIVDAAIPCLYNQK